MPFRKLDLHVSFSVLMLESSDRPELGPVFLLRCLECDEQERPSRLWLRAAIEVRSGRAEQIHHYVECMNCGSHLRSRQPDHMERVAPDEWDPICRRGWGPGSAITFRYGTARLTLVASPTG